MFRLRHQAGMGGGKKRGESLANLRPFAAFIKGDNQVTSAVSAAATPRRERAPEHVHVTVDELLCVIFALLTAASNAVAAVLQRKAAAQVPLERSMHVSLIADLMHRVWLAGIAMVIVAAAAQATAFGPIALVQPIFIIELPPRPALHPAVQAAIRSTSSLARDHHHHRRPPAGGWPPRSPVAASIGGGMSWMIALIVTAAFEAVLISTAVGLRGELRWRCSDQLAACGYVEPRRC